MATDIEIARTIKPFKINKIIKKLHLTSEDIEPYGHYKAKINLLPSTHHKKGKLILVSAITPTPLGEGKSTVSIGLADAFSRLKKNVALSLREPSLGPCFGIKGGATGGGHSQVIPMEDINLNFTGDIHAITAANNLLAALIDNHIKHGNELKIKKVLFKRCLDLNDRALRQVKISLGGKVNGTPRIDGFNISVASEIMAIFCLSQDLADLKERLDSIVIAENQDNLPVYAKDIHASGAMMAILKDALKPNLVQTLEHTPALVHGGPFANIAHGTSSIIATKTALSLCDYVITEAGFGADLGAEKFFDIFARKTNIYPDAVVLVATIRALKMHGGLPKDALYKENIPALKSGIANLYAHISNIKKFGRTPIVAINRFITDTTKELKTLQKLCADIGITAVITEGHAKGSKGCLNLAKAVLEQLEQKSAPCVLLYPDKMPLTQKIETVAKQIYGAKKIHFTKDALKDLEKFTQWGYGDFPVCIAKTQNSLSHNKNLLGAPRGYTFPITSVRLSAGAGFVVALSGDIMTMPGLPKHPAAENISVDTNGQITGLF